MVITAKLWDKKSPINGKNAEFLSGHFKKQNGNDDRVLIFYDGVIARIEYIDDCFFSVAEKSHVQKLIESGLSKEQAIAETWQKKIQEEKVGELSNLDAKYKPEFAKLAEALVLANLDKNTNLITDLQAEYAELKEKYRQEREAEANG